MAEARAFDALNPDVETPAPSESIRYSQGVHPDQSIGALFEGVGNLFEGAAKATDQFFRMTIHEEAAGATDDINERFTGRGPSPSGAGPDSTVPDEITRTGERLTRLTQGVRAGSVLNSHYWGLLDMEARRLRTKYPGYREHIDRTFSSLTGSVPANALRRALFAEAAAGRTSANAAANELRRWERTVITQTPFGPQVAERRTAGNPMTVEELQTLAARHFSSSTRLAARAAELRVGEGERTANRHQVRDFASDTVWTNIGNVFSSVPYQRLQELARRAGERVDPSGRPSLSAEEQLQLTRAFEGVRSQINSLTRSSLTELQTMGLTAEDARGIEQNVTRTLATMEEDVTRGRLQLVAAYQSLLQGLNTADRFTALSTNEHFRRLNTLRETLGPEAMGIALQNNTELMTALSRNAHILSLSRIFETRRTPAPGETEFAPPPSLNDVTKNNRDNGIPAEVNRSVRRSLLDTLKNTEAVPGVINRTVEALYGPGNLEYLNEINRGGTITDASGTRRVRSRVFNEMASPEITQRMIQLRDSGNVNAWNMYRDWVSRNGAMLALQPAQSITSIMGDTNSRIRFVFDAASNTVRAELSEPSAVRPGSLGAFSSAVLARHAVAESLAQDLTSVLQAMGPLARAESTGDDTTDQEILAILQAHNLEATPDPDNAGRMILRPRTGSRLGAGDVQPSEPASRGGVTVSDREPSPETEAEAARDEAAGASNLLNAWNEYERLNQEVRGAIETYERSPSSENLQKEIEAFERFRTFSRENRDMLEQRPVNQRNGWMDWLFGGGLRAGAEDAGVSPPEGVPSGWTVWHERRLRAIQSGEMNLDSVTNERNRTLIQGEIDRREREGVTPPPDTPGLSPDLERALERERTMTPEARRERDEAAAAADEVERNIYRESVEEARRSTDYWRRLAQEAQERGDTASASRFTERALQVEERLMSSEDRIITPRTPTQDQQQTREGPARTPAPTAVPVTRTINVDGVSNPMEAINQHNDAEVGAVLRVTVQGQEEPMFIQKTPAGWLIIPDPSKRGE